jgi:hypothetical protein
MVSGEREQKQSTSRVVRDDGGFVDVEQFEAVEEEASERVGRPIRSFAERPGVTP